MKLIEDLGRISPKPDSLYIARYGIYECPLCFDHVKVCSSSVNTGKTTMCIKCSYDARKTHGLWGTKIHSVWDGMKQRCSNPKATGYSSYGGRGIKVCDEWLNDLTAFQLWSLANGFNDKLTIDRIDVNGNYEPTNCRWATTAEQGRNKRIRK